MKLDDLKDDWKNQITKPQEVDISPMIELLMKETLALDRAVKRRNFLETSAAGIILVISIYALINSVSLMQSIGLWIWIVACILIPIKLIYSSNNNLGNQGLKYHLIKEKEKIQRQIDLMGSVMYWYILPLLSGMILVYLGGNIDENGEVSLTLEGIIYLSSCILMAVVIYAYNKYDARKSLQPVLDRINQQLDNECI